MISASPKYFHHPPISADPCLPPLSQRDISGEKRIASFLLILFLLLSRVFPLLRDFVPIRVQLDLLISFYQGTSHCDLPGPWGNLRS